MVADPRMVKTLYAVFNAEKKNRTVYHQVRGDGDTWACSHSRACWEAGGSLHFVAGKNNEDAGNRYRRCSIARSWCAAWERDHAEAFDKMEKHMMVVFDMRNTKDARERVDTTCEADQKRMMEKEDRS